MSSAELAEMNRPKNLMDDVDDSALDVVVHEQRVQVTRNIGVGAMLLGLIGLLGLPFSLLSYRSGLFLVASSWETTSGDMLFVLFFDLVGAFLAFAAFAGGAGAMTLKTWSRPLLLLYCIGTLALGILGFFVFTRWFVPGDGVTRRTMGEVTIALAPLWLWGFGSIFSVVALFYLTRPGMASVLEDELHDEQADMGAAGE